MATGIAAAIKLTPLLFVPTCSSRRTRGAGACVATFGICEAIAIVLSPGSSWMYWTRSVFDVTRVGGYLGSNGLLAPTDQSLASVLDRFHHTPVPSVELWVLNVLVGAAGPAIAVLAHRRWSPTLGSFSVQRRHSLSLRSPGRITWCGSSRSSSGSLQRPNDLAPAGWLPSVQGCSFGVRHSGGYRRALDSCARASGSSSQEAPFLAGRSFCSAASLPPGCGGALVTETLLVPVCRSRIAALSVDS